MKNILAMKMKNLSFTIDNSHRECHPLQFVRELTHNSIQAILRKGNPGQIIWSIDKEILRKTGVSKLTITDTGSGMTGKELIEYLNNYSSSSQKQSYDGNFGIGAKIAALPKNKKGLIYQSWKENKGAMIHLQYDEENNEYGLAPIKQPDGSYKAICPLPLKSKPDLIKGSGTKVILYGNSKNQDTSLLPEEADMKVKSIWLSGYLNSRYFTIPNLVSIKAIEKYRGGEEFHRRILGHKNYLDKNSKSSGSVSLEKSKIKVHWWILKETQDRDSWGASLTSGHIAIIFQDELYNVSTGKSGISKLQEFGVTFGASSVVLCIEPLGKKIFANAARTQVLINHLPAPWEQWAIAFSKDIPQELKDHIREKSEAFTKGNYVENIKLKVMAILKYLESKKFRKTQNGKDKKQEDLSNAEIHLSDEYIGGNKKDGRGDNDKEDGGEDFSDNIPKIESESHSNNIIDLFIRDGEVPAEPVCPEIPNIKWITEKQEGDPEDRAARFIKTQNEIHLYEYFRAFKSLVAILHKEYGENPVLLPLIERSVKEQMSFCVVQHICGVHSLRGSPCWEEKDFDQALSENSLTMLLMERYNLIGNVRKSVGTRIGRGHLEMVKNHMDLS